MLLSMFRDSPVESIAEMHLDSLGLPASSFLVEQVTWFMQQPEHKGAGPSSRKALAESTVEYLWETVSEANMLSSPVYKLHPYRIHLADLICTYLWDAEQSTEHLFVLCMNRETFELNVLSLVILLYMGDGGIRRMLAVRCDPDILCIALGWTLSQDPPELHTALSQLGLEYTGQLRLTSQTIIDYIVADRVGIMSEHDTRRVVSHFLSILFDPAGRCWSVDQLTMQAFGLLVHGEFLAQLPETDEEFQHCIEDALLLFQDPEAFLFQRAQQQQQQQQAEPAKHLQSIEFLVATEHHQHQTCVLCLDTIVPGQAVAILPCKHLFHADNVPDECGGIRTWLQGGQQCEGRGTCPLCNQRVDTSLPPT